MSSGRSSSRGAPRLVATLVVVAATLAMGAGAPAPPAFAQAIPPPPPNAGEPEAPTTAKPKPPVRRSACSKCGYLADADWHYCAACGWDLTTLVGAAEVEKLEAVAQATMRLVVGGRRNRHATVIPYGGPGLYLTNARVLVGADESRLTLYTFNNRQVVPTIVGYDLPSGVGLLRANPGPLPEVAPAPAPPADGESAWAVCYPIVFEDDLVRYLPVSMHRGHVTGTAQSGTWMATIENFLRTDHAIEEGCAGGALVDRRGRLAGMIMGSKADGLTFAVPLTDLDPILASLLKNEKPARPYFGLGLAAPDDRRRAQFALDPAASGPLLAFLVPGSPAAKAGAMPGDILLAVNGKTVSGVRDAGDALLRTAPGGAAVELRLKRGATGDLTVSVPPIARPERAMLEPLDELQESLELVVRDVHDGAKDAPQGLVVSEVVRGGRGEKSRWRNGDVIVAVDEKGVKNARAFNDYFRMQFKEIFADKPPGTARFPSSYMVVLEVRNADKEKVYRRYINLFPDILAPPVF